MQGAWSLVTSFRHVSAMQQHAGNVLTAVSMQEASLARETEIVSFRVESKIRTSKMLSWVLHIRDTQPLKTWEFVKRYVRCHIFCRWNHHPQTRTWMSTSVASIRYFVWRPYVSIIIPAKLHVHLDVCDTVGPLVSFECVEWLLAD
ncbi:hypothetical protein Ahy_B02g057825 [Arachis hypogaea]|uniref:Aminotransferase-like plant mobile domain-containing protein n=1 Tax=Arachis hypogaea TaxID=3818 RepID=A0A445ACZ9_ARAHY|nr:hypothetical protein Ahy_B02g057825 [Arachis hypogaea]